MSKIQKLLELVKGPPVPFEAHAAAPRANETAKPASLQVGKNDAMSSFQTVGNRFGLSGPPVPFQENQAPQRSKYETKDEFEDVPAPEGRSILKSVLRTKRVWLGMYDCGDATVTFGQHAIEWLPVAGHALPVTGEYPHISVPLSTMTCFEVDKVCAAHYHTCIFVCIELSDWCLREPALSAFRRCGSLITWHNLQTSGCHSLRCTSQKPRF